MGNEIRLGKVSAVDHPAGMVRVVYHEKDDDVTRMIPILSTVFSGVYSMPEVGDQVLVLHLSNGTEAGVVLGRPWSEKTKPPEGAEKLYRLDMDRAPGVAMVRYDGKAKDLTIHCDGTLNITAGRCRSPERRSRPAIQWPQLTPLSSHFRCRPGPSRRWKRRPRSWRRAFC